MGRRPSFEEQRQRVEQLLKDHRQVYKGGPQGIADFGEMGPPKAGAEFATKRFMKRYFESDEEAESHAAVEEQLQVLRERVPRLSDPIDRLHFRADAGDADVEFVRKKAQEGASWAQNIIQLYDWGLDLLTLRLWEVELTVKFAKPRSKREEGEMKERNRNLAAQYRDYVRRGLTPTEAKKNLEHLYGISMRRIEQILEANEEAS